MKIEFEEPPPLSTTLAFTLLRIVIGVIFALHGWQKLVHFAAWQGHVAQLGIPEPEIAAWLAIAGELLGGIGLVVGRFTRVAASGAASVMLVAIASEHLTHGLFAQQGGFEYPLVLLCVAIVFVAVGGGYFSADRFLRERARLKAIQTDETWQRPPYTPIPPAPIYADRHLRGPRLHQGYRG